MRQEMNKDWEPIPQPEEYQPELQIEIPPDEPPAERKQKPAHEMGENVTPADANEDIGGYYDGDE